MDFHKFDTVVDEFYGINAGDESKDRSMEVDGDEAVSLDNCDTFTTTNSVNSQGQLSPISVDIPPNSNDSTAPGSSPSKRKIRKEKTCLVCGDRALGYNFDAISCESCKAFFRRNALKGLEAFNCPYEGNCKMDVANRRFCKRCRLAKCFSVGMKKEFILSEEEKSRKRRLIEENRRMKEADRASDRSSNPAISPGIKIDDSECRVSSSTDYPMMDYEEAQLLDELNKAFESSLQASKEEPHTRSADFTDIVNISEKSVRRIIAMAKRIKCFKALAQEDQISLLKGGAIELLVIRSAISFNRDSRIFLDPKDNEAISAMPLDELTCAAQHTGIPPRVFEAHMQFVEELLSTPGVDRPDLIDKDLISDHQDRYAQLLLHYLQSRIRITEAKQVYPKLLMRLTQVRDINEDLSRALIHIDAENVQPLMTEFLDLLKPSVPSSPSYQ